jgi:hypothetical protein
MISRLLFLLFSFLFAYIYTKKRHLSSVSSGKKTQPPLTKANLRIKTSGKNRSDFVMSQSSNPPDHKHSNDIVSDITPTTSPPSNFVPIKDMTNVESGKLMEIIPICICIVSKLQ